MNGRKANATEFCKASGQSLALVPEPTNKHDGNAIIVLGEWKGWFRRKRKVLGYVPAETAATLAKSGNVAYVQPRLLKTYLGTDGFVEIEFQIIGPKDLYESVFPKKHTRAEESSKATVDQRNIDATEQVRSVIELMDSTPVMAPEKSQALSKAHFRKAWARMLETGETYGQAAGGLAFLNRSQDKVRGHLRSIDNDLAAQAEIVEDTFRDYLKTGEVPPPYYAWRIAVILSKAKRKDLEREFLASWCKHFPKGNGSRYDDLVVRARKLGVEV
ncbi:HIRAN domain-containing protein [uncultured Roseibium sp.]|uniref:HIRAN domain-containing protein n=1 Tax=uncultured Roseibium sp. TaxID=1936171 RepID=UPI002609776F|nr:HIRAN domain-containing protein [uncultured Roseibium sp.]